MRTRMRVMPMVRRLARSGCQRGLGQWTVRCRDGRGRRTHLTIHLHEHGIILTTSSPGPWSLAPLDAGRLRGAIRDALLCFNHMTRLPNSGTHSTSAIDGSRSPPTSSPRTPAVIANSTPSTAGTDTDTREFCATLYY